jgi:ATP-dependent DNA ligase
MPALNCFGSKGKAVGILPSHPYRPGEQSVLPPFSGELRVDEELTMSNENFTQTIGDLLKKKKKKNLSSLSQLTITPPFPTSHMLSQFASKSNRDYKIERLILSMRHG